MLYPKMVGKLAEYCKTELGIESVSIVTNGSKVTERFLQTYGKFIDIIAISCDSFNEGTNIKIGRGKGDHLQHITRLRELCKKYDIKFKINSVINRYNFDEDMRGTIEQIKPFRWKCFQVMTYDIHHH